MDFQIKPLRVMLEQGFAAQTQPTEMTCVQTCIAMVLGIPVADVIEKVGHHGLNGRTLCHLLNACRVNWNQFSHADMIATGWYLVAVPSLNHRGLMHQIIVHQDTSRGCNGTTVFDPAMGTKYARDGSDLRSWGEIILFEPGGRLPESPYQVQAPSAWRPFHAADRASYPPDNTRVMLRHSEGRDGICLGSLVFVSPSHGRTWMVEVQMHEGTTSVDPTEWCPIPE